MSTQQRSNRWENAGKRKDKEEQEIGMESSRELNGEYVDNINELNIAR